MDMIENEIALADSNIETSGPLSDIIRKVIIIMQISALFASVFLAINAPPVLSRPFMWLLVIMAIGSVLTQSLYHYFGLRPVNWFVVDIMFIFTFLIVHFFYVFYWLIGRIDGSIKIWRNETRVTYGTTVALSGLLAFIIGFNLVKEKWSCVQISNNLNDAVVRRWRLVGTVMFLAGVTLSVVFALVVGSEFFEGEYSGGTVGGYLSNVISIGLRMLLDVGFLVLTIAAALRTGKWKIGLIPKLFLAFFVVYLMILGHRSVMVIMLLLLGAAYSEYVKYISLKKLLLGLLAGMFLMGVIQVTRAAKERSFSAFVKTIGEQSEEISWESGLLNLGWSVQTLYVAVDEIPSHFNYFHGKLKVSELLGIIPFGRKLVPFWDIQFLNSSYFFTWIVYGNFESGAGSTIIADIYPDFGYSGVIIIMFLIGMLCKYVQQKARGSGSFVWGVANACMLATMVLITRNNVLNLIRGVLWPVLLVVFVGLIMGITKSSQSQLSETEY